MQIIHDSLHSKGYLFLGPDRAALVVGSSNFSRAGLATNVEMNVVVEQPRDHADMQQDIELFEKQWRAAPPLTAAQLARCQALTQQENMMPQDIQPGDRVRVGGRVGDVIKVEPIGEAIQYTIFFEGEVPRRILVPPNTVEKISDPLAQARAGQFDLPWRFDLLSQAVRLGLAYEYHHLLSLSNSRTDLQPYQVEAVYRVISAARQRFLVADEVGLGKTIEAGMVLKELEARARAKRILIVTPAPLTDQWTRELREKFGIRLHRYDSSRLALLRASLSKTENPWNHEQHIVTSVDFAKQDHVLAELRLAEPWDVMIFDEAHNLGISKFGTKVNRTQRYNLAEEIAPQSETLLLLTATPHKGDDFAFTKLISLLDPFLFPSSEHLDPQRVADVMIRRVKDDLRDANGEPVFRPRTVETIPVQFTREEMALYNAVTRYVAEEFNMARQTDQRSVGFAMIILQKRMVSSIAAIRKSLGRRSRNLLMEHTELSRSEEADLESLIDEPDTLTEPRAEELTRRLEQLTLHSGAGLQTEISRLNQLRQMAEELAVDSKSAKLLELIDGVLAKDPTEKIIVFTEYRDTLDYLHQRLLAAGLSPKQFAFIHGDMAMPQRQEQEAYFASPGVNILLATDAASEGINLQFCHILVNYELPWNPNRIDQRIGRIHRYGQERDVHVYNLLVEGTREGDIFIRLQEKIQNIERQLQGKVTNVLGTCMQGVDLTDIIMTAVSANVDVEVTDQHLEEAIQEQMRAWEQIQDRFLGSLQHFDLDTIESVIDRSDKITASNADIEEFVRIFFAQIGGRVENTRYKNVYRLITPRLLTAYPQVQTNYEQVAFQKEDARRFPPDEVEFIAFGHPLLTAIVTECNKRDEGFGGATTARPMPKETQTENGILFNFVLRYTDAAGETLSEEFLPIFVTHQGTVDVEVGQGLLAHVRPDDTTLDAGSEAVAQMCQSLDDLHAAAIHQAQAISEDQCHTVSDKRERDIAIQLEDLERWYQARNQPHLERLEEYKQRLAMGEDMNIAIRGEEQRLLNEVQEPYESRKQELENQRAVVPQAPELLNLVLLVNVV